MALLFAATCDASMAYGIEQGCATSTVSSMAAIDREPIDVFLVAGQSNATGIPDTASTSPKVPEAEALQYYNGRVSTANDPVGNANLGSAWPEFGLIYNQETGHRALFVPASVPASSMTAAGDFLGGGHWDESGRLFSIATAKADEALRAAGPKARFAGVLWSQGENDGLAINVKFETPSEYKSALEKLIARFRARYGVELPFFIFQTGLIIDRPPAGFEAVRTAQLQVSEEARSNLVVFKGAVTFVTRKLMAKNGVHYSQEGYNIMGREGATAVVAYFRRFAAAGCR